MSDERWRRWGRKNMIRAVIDDITGRNKGFKA
jgi:hypothetical protein